MNRAAFRPLIAVLAATALIAGCSKSGGGGEQAATIKIGEFASLTGKEATFGTSSHEGTVLAIEELNAAGGAAGQEARADLPKTTAARRASPPPSPRS